MEQTQSNFYQITSYENSDREALAAETLDLSLKPPIVAQMEETQKASLNQEKRENKEKDEQTEEVPTESSDPVEQSEPQTSIQKLLQRHNLKFQ